MAIDSVDKRRNIGMVYYETDGAIDTEAERKAVIFIYKTDTEISITAILGGTVFGQDVLAVIKGQHTIANIDGQDTTATIKGAG